MVISAASPPPDRGQLRGVARQAVLHAAKLMTSRSLFIGNAEPSLDEVMGDPMVRGLMARDGVAEDHLRSLIDRIGRNLL